MEEVENAKKSLIEVKGNAMRSFDKASTRHTISCPQKLNSEARPPRILSFRPPLTCRGKVSLYFLLASTMVTTSLIVFKLAKSSSFRSGRSNSCSCAKEGGEGEAGRAGMSEYRRTCGRPRITRGGKATSGARGRAEDIC